MVVNYCVNCVKIESITKMTAWRTTENQYGPGYFLRSTNILSPAQPTKAKPV